VISSLLWGLLFVDFDCSCSKITCLSLIVVFTVEVLKQIGKTLGKNWDFSADPCGGEKGWATPNPVKGFENAVTCNCSFSNNTICHVISMYVSYFLGKIFSLLLEKMGIICCWSESSAFIIFLSPTPLNVVNLLSY